MCAAFLYQVEGNEARVGVCGSISRRGSSTWSGEEEREWDTDEHDQIVCSWWLRVVSNPADYGGTHGDMREIALPCRSCCGLLPQACGGCEL